MQLRLAAMTAAAVGALCVAGAATPASATLVLTSLICSNTDIDPTAADCSGWFEGNLLNESSIEDQQDALALIGFVWDGNWAEVDATKVDAGGPGTNEFDFDGVLDGTAFIGIHKGIGGPGGVEGTAFFKIEADNVDVVTLLLGGASSAVVYDFGDGGGPGTGIPEPATWAMMILGFAGMGALIRRRRAALA